MQLKKQYTIVFIYLSIKARTTQLIPDRTFYYSIWHP